MADRPTEPCGNAEPHPRHRFMRNAKVSDCPGISPRLDNLIDRACRHLTPDEGAALRAGVQQLRSDRDFARIEHDDTRDTFNIAWEQQAAELERARGERGTYRAAWHSARNRARKHRAAVDDMWDVNTRLAERARRAEKQLADARGTLADRIQRAYPDDYSAAVIADHIRGTVAWPDEDEAPPAREDGQEPATDARTPARDPEPDGGANGAHRGAEGREPYRAAFARLLPEQSWHLAGRLADIAAAIAAQHPTRP